MASGVAAGASFASTEIGFLRLGSAAKITYDLQDNAGNYQAWHVTVWSWEGPIRTRCAP